MQPFFGHAARHSLRRIVSEEWVSGMFLLTISPTLFKHGKVVDNKSEYDDENMTWEYFIAGADVDGVALAVIFSIDSEDGEITLITVRDI